MNPVSDKPVALQSDDVATIQPLSLTARLAGYVAPWLVRLAHLIASRGDLSIALLMTVVFYFPSLQNTAKDAGYVYTGDVLGYFLPALMKTHYLIGNGHYDALDLSLFDGSSDFFLSPNFFATHPAVALFSLLWPTSDLSVGTHRVFLVLLLAAHTFAASFFTLTLARRHLGIPRPAATLASAAFAFSMYMVAATGQPPFILCTSVLPWIIAAALDYVREPSLRRLLIAVLPITLALLGGYPPLGAACVGMALLFIVVQLSLKVPRPSSARLSDCIVALMPYTLASVLIAPFYYAVSSFHAETMSSHSGGIHYSAHQLAASPQTIYGALSAYWLAHGAVHEFMPIWGVVPLLIIAMFIVSPVNLDLSSRRIALALSGIYCTVLLSIYGDYSVVADLVYYFVPKIGRMHIYQRFLLLAQLAFALALALMAQSLARGPIPRARLALAILFGSTIASGILTARFQSLATVLGITNHLTVELVTGCILAALMIAPNHIVLPAAAAVLFCLPSFDRMYDRSHYGNTYAAARAAFPVALDDTLQQQVADFFSTAGPHKRIKYVDITPIWAPGGGESFPKTFPYFVLDKVRLTSFGGFTFYLSARADFLQHAPVRGDEAVVQPEWNLIEQSGVDFVVARPADMNNEALRTRLGITDEGTLRLPTGAWIYRTRFTGDLALEEIAKSATENGWFRLLPAAIGPGADRHNLAFQKQARQSSTTDGPAPRAVDGDCTGDYAHGSVTHTQADPNAWLEIDLGQAVPIGEVRVWGRTDGSQDRLSDFWVFISSTPFPDGSTAAEIRDLPDVSSYRGMKPTPEFTLRAQGAVGRYVRIQLGGNTSPLGDYLSIAECEVFAPAQRLDPADVSLPLIEAFESNDANWLSMTVNAPEPAIAQYLLWPNPRAVFYLDGKPTVPTDVNGLAAVQIPAGRHVVEMRYRHWPLRLFWLLYAGYGFALVAITVPSAVVRAAAMIGSVFCGTSIPRPSDHATDAASVSSGSAS